MTIACNQSRFYRDAVYLSRGIILRKNRLNKTHSSQQKEQDWIDGLISRRWSELRGV